MKGDFLHGGVLDRMRAEFPAAPEPWLDLSTGINPVPYELATVFSKEEAEKIVNKQKTLHTVYGVPQWYPENPGVPWVTLGSPGVPRGTLGYPRVPWGIPGPPQSNLNSQTSEDDWAHDDSNKMCARKHKTSKKSNARIA